MTTPSDLIETLRKLGVEVTPRRLTDWRSKRLLPQLAERGAGRGRGKVYGWNEPEIVEQAIVLEDLLAEKSRSRFAAVELWRMGFPVSVDLALKGWEFQLSWHQAAIEARAEKYPDRSDLFGVMATFKGEPPDKKLDKAVQIAFGIKLLELLFSPTRVHIDDDDAQVVLQFLERHVEGLHLDLTGRELRKRTQEFSSFVRNLLSRPLLLQAVTDATADHLRVISRVLVELRTFCGGFIRTSLSDGIEACLEGNRAIGLLGSIVAGLLIRIEDIEDLESVARFLIWHARHPLTFRSELSSRERQQLREDFDSQIIEERRRITGMLTRFGYPEWFGAIGNS